MNTSDLVFIVAVCLSVFVLLLVTGRVWSRWQLRRWCAREGYELLEWRGARFFEDPGAWFRSEKQDAYYIEVRDRKGVVRTGRVVFGSYWLPHSGRIRVEWD